MSLDNAQGRNKAGGGSQQMHELCLRKISSSVTPTVQCLEKNLLGQPLLSHHVFVVAAVFAGELSLHESESPFLQYISKGKPKVNKRDAHLF